MDKIKFFKLISGVVAVIFFITSSVSAAPLTSAAPLKQPTLRPSAEANAGASGLAERLASLAALDPAVPVLNLVADEKAPKIPFNLAEVGHQLIPTKNLPARYERSKGPYTYVGLQTRGEHPKSLTPVNFEGDIEDICSEEALARRFAVRLLEYKSSSDAHAIRDKIEQNIVEDRDTLLDLQGASLRKALKIVVRKGTYSEAERRSKPKLIKIVLMNVTEAAQEGNRLARKWIMDVGIEIGQALAAFVAEYKNSRFIKHISLASAVNDRFGRGIVDQDGEDLYAKTIRNTFKRTLIYSYDVEEDTAKRLAKSIVHFKPAHIDLDSDPQEIVEPKSSSAGKAKVTQADHSDKKPIDIKRKRTGPFAGLFAWNRYPKGEQVIWELGVGEPLKNLNFAEGIEGIIIEELTPTHAEIRLRRLASRLRIAGALAEEGYKHLSGAELFSKAITLEKRAEQTNPLTVLKSLPQGPDAWAKHFESPDAYEYFKRAWSKQVIEWICNVLIPWAKKGLVSIGGERVKWAKIERLQRVYQYKEAIFSLPGESSVTVAWNEAKPTELILKVLSPSKDFNIDKEGADLRAQRLFDAMYGGILGMELPHSAISGKSSSAGQVKVSINSDKEYPSRISQVSIDGITFIVDKNPALAYKTTPVDSGIEISSAAMLLYLVNETRVTGYLQKGTFLTPRLLIEHKEEYEKWAPEGYSKWLHIKNLSDSDVLAILEKFNIDFRSSIYKIWMEYVKQQWPNSSILENWIEKIKQENADVPAKSSSAGLDNYAEFTPILSTYDTDLDSEVKNQLWHLQTALGKLARVREKSEFIRLAIKDKKFKGETEDITLDKVVSVIGRFRFGNEDENMCLLLLEYDDTNRIVAVDLSGGFPLYYFIAKITQSRMFNSTVYPEINILSKPESEIRSKWNRCIEELAGTAKSSSAGITVEINKVPAIFRYLDIEEEDSIRSIMSDLSGKDGLQSSDPWIKAWAVINLSLFDKNIIYKCRKDIIPTLTSKSGLLNRNSWKKLWAAIGLSLLDKKTKSEYKGDIIFILTGKNGLRSRDPWKRLWAAIGLSLLDKKTKSEYSEEIKSILPGKVGLRNNSPWKRTRAAVSVSLLAKKTASRYKEDIIFILTGKDGLRSKDPWKRLWAAIGLLSIDKGERVLRVDINYTGLKRPHTILAKDTSELAAKLQKEVFTGLGISCKALSDTRIELSTRYAYGKTVTETVNVYTKEELEQALLRVLAPKVFTASPIFSPTVKFSPDVKSYEDILQGLIDLEARCKDKLANTLRIMKKPVSLNRISKSTNKDGYTDGLRLVHGLPSEARDNFNVVIKQNHGIGYWTAYLAGVRVREVLERIANQLRSEQLKAEKSSAGSKYLDAGFIVDARIHHREFLQLQFTKGVVKQLLALFKEVSGAKRGSPSVFIEAIEQESYPNIVSAIHINPDETMHNWRWEYLILVDDYGVDKIIYATVKPGKVPPYVINYHNIRITALDKFVRFALPFIEELSKENPGAAECWNEILKRIGPEDTAGPAKASSAGEVADDSLKAITKLIMLGNRPSISVKTTDEDYDRLIKMGGLSNKLRKLVELLGGEFQNVLELSKPQQQTAIDKSGLEIEWLDFLGFKLSLPGGSPPSRVYALKLKPDLDLVVLPESHIPHLMDAPNALILCDAKIGIVAKPKSSSAGKTVEIPVSGKTNNITCFSEQVLNERLSASPGLERELQKILELCERKLQPSRDELNIFLGLEKLNPSSLRVYAQVKRHPDDLPGKITIAHTIRDKEGGLLFALFTEQETSAVKMPYSPQERKPDQACDRLIKERKMALIKSIDGKEVSPPSTVELTVGDKILAISIEPADYRNRMGEGSATLRDMQKVRAKLAFVGGTNVYTIRQEIMALGLVVLKYDSLEYLGTYKDERIFVIESIYFNEKFFFSDKGIERLSNESAEMMRLSNDGHMGVVRQIKQAKSSSARKTETILVNDIAFEAKTLWTLELPTEAKAPGRIALNDSVIQSMFMDTGFKIAGQLYIPGQDEACIAFEKAEEEDSPDTPVLIWLDGAINLRAFVLNLTIEKLEELKTVFYGDKAAQKLLQCEIDLLKAQSSKSSSAGTVDVDEFLWSKGVCTLISPSVENAEELIKIISDAGCPYLGVEIAFRGDRERVLRLLKSASEYSKSKIVVAAGTVLNAQDAFGAIENGARLIVTPGLTLTEADIERIHTLGAKVVMGVGSPKEAQIAKKRKADAIKAFPYNIKSDHIKALKGPLPNKYHDSADRYLQLIKGGKDILATFTNVYEWLKTNPTRSKRFRLPLTEKDLVKAIKGIIPSGIAVFITGGVLSEDIKQGLLDELEVGAALSVKDIEEAKKMVEVMKSRTMKSSSAGEQTEVSVREVYRMLIKAADEAKAALLSRLLTSKTSVFDNIPYESASKMIYDEASGDREKAKRLIDEVVEHIGILAREKHTGFALNLSVTGEPPIIPSLDDAGWEFFTKSQWPDISNKALKQVSEFIPYLDQDGRVYPDLMLVKSRDGLKNIVWARRDVEFTRLTIGLTLPAAKIINAFKSSSAGQVEFIMHTVAERLAGFFFIPKDKLNVEVIGELKAVLKEQKSRLTGLGRLSCPAEDAVRAGLAITLGNYLQAIDEVERLALVNDGFNKIFEEILQKKTDLKLHHYQPAETDVIGTIIINEDELQHEQKNEMVRLFSKISKYRAEAIERLGANVVLKNEYNREEDWAPHMVAISKNPIPAAEEARLLDITIEHTPDALLPVDKGLLFAKGLLLYLVTDRAPEVEVKLSELYRLLRKGQGEPLQETELLDRFIDERVFTLLLPKPERVDKEQHHKLLRLRLLTLIAA